MDIPVSKKPHPLPFTAGTLKDKAAVVTGSTSGIGLGIAEALAAQGADVLLNGFGAPTEIDRLRGSLADAHGVRVSYSAADMAKPDEIDGMIAQATRDLGGGFPPHGGGPPLKEGRGWGRDQKPPPGPGPGRSPPKGFYRRAKPGGP